MNFEINPLIMKNDKQVVNDIGKIDTATLRAELAKALTITAKGLYYLAAIWAELERRGEDLNDLRTGIAVYLPLIAAGKLDAEVVVQFAGQKTVLRHLALMPIYEQKELVAGKKIKIISRVDSKIIERELPLQAMRAAEVNQVFSDGRILTATEQRERFDPKIRDAVRKPGERKEKINLLFSKSEKQIIENKA